MEYRLPENGPEGENGQGDTPVPDTPVQEREPEVVPEEEQPQDRRAEYVRNALLTLAAVLALGLLALTVRALLGRRRLRQAAARYQDPDCRMGCGYILCAVHDPGGRAASMTPAAGERTGRRPSRSGTTPPATACARSTGSSPAKPGGWWSGTRPGRWTTG